ncbi:Os02g0142100 [Oryza sativa Japonica Group]|jgi:hypothetical protein|uniref:Os02g0142100 protein n=2 Tax=Oryza sativa subsp. japonica TaxID=39947 RepID=Q0E413_ORYSJ|nr:hypothetical protein EE612_008801 [Oryza sativa]BAF07775.1 Os02g0142100 [Oryza sativa Japonica Group]BAS76929.1 Os02g0142100 [Oryza sativa Japonica Group]|eukprot:NP_001045861.1 Os02g0142100 [Oryza sativa Japonica Group]
MASSSSSTSTNSLFCFNVSEKLSKQNYQLWCAQVLTAIRGARLKGHLKGKTVTPAAHIEAEKKEDDKTKIKIMIDNPAYERVVCRGSTGSRLPLFIAVTEYIIPGCHGDHSDRCLEDDPGDVQLQGDSRALPQRAAISHQH